MSSAINCSSFLDKGRKTHIHEHKSKNKETIRRKHHTIKTKQDLTDWSPFCKRSFETRYTWLDLTHKTSNHVHFAILCLLQEAKRKSQKADGWKKQQRATSEIVFLGDDWCSLRQTGNYASEFPFISFKYS